jgi:hypothetical protein
VRPRHGASREWKRTASVVIESGTTNAGLLALSMPLLR